MAERRERGVYGILDGKGGWYVPLGTRFPTPYFYYSAFNQVAHAVQDMAMKALQVARVEDLKMELQHMLEYDFNEAVRQKQAGEVGDIVGLKSFLITTYHTLLSNWQKGILNGVGAAFSSAVEQFYGIGNLLHTYKQMMWEIAVTPRIRRDYMSTYTPTVPDDHMAWLLWKRGAITEGDFDRYAEYEGWDKQGRGFLKKVWETIPNERVAFRMFARGVLKTEDKNILYGMNSWPKDYYDRLDAIFEWLPNAREAFHLFRRDAINLSTMKSLFKAQGLAEKWTTPLMSGWERILLPNDAFRLYMRGKISYKTYETYVKMNEWEDGAAANLYEVYQRLPSSREAFYMERKGIISWADRDALYKANGYDPKYHSALTQNYEYTPTLYDLTRIADYVEMDLIWATKILRERGLRDRDISKIVAMLKIRPLKNEITRQVTVWINRYALGWVSPTQFEEALQTMLEAGYIQATEKTLVTAEGELKYEDELMREQIDIYSWRFKTAIITEEDLLQGFLDLGIREEKANLMVELLKAQGYYGYY